MADPAKLIGDLVRAYPGKAIHGDTVRVYVRELSDVPPAILEEAVRALIRTSEWFPSVAAIRQAVAERTLALPSEAEALAQVSARSRWARQDEDERGDRPDVHPLVREALDQVGGWFAFRSADEPGVVRGQFLRLYKELRAAALADARLGTLALSAGRQAPALAAGSAEPRAAVS